MEFYPFPEFPVRLGDSSCPHSREYKITADSGYIWNTNSDATSDRAYTGTAFLVERILLNTLH